MSRDEIHGGGSWAFPYCVWSPSEKKGGGSWPFWSKILEINEGDVIIHLRGIPPEANFVGYSIASENGFVTERRPLNPGNWDFAERYNRANLTNFTPFHQQVNLNDIFTARKSELEEYFERNKMRGAQKANLFYVKQAGRLQCLNGAYLSDIDEELLNILFGFDGTMTPSGGSTQSVSVETGTQISTVSTRIGQSRFAKEIKKLYSNTCCFPGCTIADQRFLVCSHIARWTDNEKLRGEPGNGLCFCLLHDKAFELGLFSLDDQFKVFINPKERMEESSVLRKLASHDREQIKLAEIRSLEEALLEHWNRVNINPREQRQTL